MPLMPVCIWFLIEMVVYYWLLIAWSSGTCFQQSIGIYTNLPTVFHLGLEYKKYGISRPYKELLSEVNSQI